MHVWSTTTLKSLIAPGGLLLLVVALLLHTGLFTLASPSLNFLYYSAVTAGLLLAWRFHSSRVFFAILAIFLARQAIMFFYSGHTPLTGAGYTALLAIALLLPVNFVILSLIPEAGFSMSGVVPTAVFLFVQTVIVAVLCRGGETPFPMPSHASHGTLTAVPLPGYAWLAFGLAAAALLARFFIFRKPVESSFLWSLVAFFLALHFGATGRIATTYFAASLCILALSIIETSYLLAYHDELTTLPSRRAFNDVLLRLQTPYSIAIADIDHFKQFNDQHGHDTGDQVLRLVASKLARVTGGGQAYRYGGEEFALLFPGKTTSEVVEHLEQLRAAVESSAFRMRAADRRQAPRGPERRSQRGRAQTGRAIRQLAQADRSSAVSVTVSIGVATSAREEQEPDQVIQAADKALYRAKAAGRNRVETASSARRRIRVKAAGIA